jgi:hypothetical protein
VDGIEDIDVQRNVQASGGQANDNAPAPDDPIKGGQQSSQQGAGGGGVGTANTDQSGTGWTGLDLLDSASTSTYSAPSLDALLNIPSSLVPKSSRSRPTLSTPSGAYHPKRAYPAVYSQP